MMGAMIKYAQCINLKEKKKQIKAILGRKECETIFLKKEKYNEYCMCKKEFGFCKRKQIIASPIFLLFLQC